MDVGLPVLDRGKRRRLGLLGGDERVTARDQADDDAALLGRRRVRRGLEPRGLAPREARLPPRLADAVARALHLRCDPLVLPADAAEELEVVDQVGKARRPQHERDEVGAVAHVELADAELESPQRSAVLPPEAREPRGLRRDAPVERAEARAGAGEGALQHVEPRLLGAHARLEPAHAAGDRAQLLGEDARAALGVRRAVAQLAELTVDLRLLAPRVAGRRARKQQARDQDGGCGG